MDRRLEELAVSKDIDISFITGLLHVRHRDKDVLNTKKQFEMVKKKKARITFLPEYISSITHKYHQAYKNWVVEAKKGHLPDSNNRLV